MFKCLWPAPCCSQFALFALFSIIIILQAVTAGPGADGLFADSAIQLLSALLAAYSATTMALPEVDISSWWELFREPLVAVIGQLQNLLQV